MGGIERYKHIRAILLDFGYYNRTGKTVKHRQYHEFIKTCHEIIQQEMITNSYVFRPPYDCGEFMIREYTEKESEVRGFIRHRFYKDKSYRLWWHKERSKLPFVRYYNAVFRMSMRGSKYLCNMDGLGKHFENLYFQRDQPSYIGYHMVDPKRRRKF